MKSPNDKWVFDFSSDLHLTKFARKVGLFSLGRCAYW